MPRDLLTIPCCGKVTELYASLLNIKTTRIKLVSLLGQDSGLVRLETEFINLQDQGPGLISNIGKVWILSMSPMVPGEYRDSTDQI